MAEYCEYLTVSAYDITCLDDELRIDELCNAILKDYHASLLNDLGYAPLLAGTLARGADYFLRDFMIDAKRCNIFEISTDLVKEFAGNWYIINNIDPSINELKDILAGIYQFYSYCSTQKLIPEEQANTLLNVCNNVNFYSARIDSFFTVSGESYQSWLNECSEQKRK